MQSWGSIVHTDHIDMEKQPGPFILRNHGIRKKQKLQKQGGASYK